MSKKTALRREIWLVNLIKRAAYKNLRRLKFHFKFDEPIIQIYLKFYLINLVYFVQI